MGDTAEHTTLTLGALADAFEVLQTFAETPLDGATAAAVLRLSQWAHPHYRRYLEVRGQVAAAHGEELAPGRYHVPPEKVAAYDEAMAPARAEPVELGAALLIPIAGLAAAPVTPRGLAALSPFLAGL